VREKQIQEDRGEINIFNMTKRSERETNTDLEIYIAERKTYIESQTAKRKKNEYRTDIKECSREM
jgi:hypothetical protein